MCRDNERWDQLFGDIIWLRGRIHRIEQQLEHIMTTQSQSQADVNAANTAVVALLTDVSDDVATILADVKSIQAALASGQPVDTTALDSTVAGIAAVQSSLDSATSQLTGVVPPAGSGSTVTVSNPGPQTSSIAAGAVSVQVVASDSDPSQTLSYEASGLPAGLSIDPAAGLISGTPTTAGTSSVVVTVVDTTGAGSGVSFTWTVTA